MTDHTHPEREKRYTSNNKESGLYRAQLWIASKDKAYFEKLAEDSRNAHRAKNQTAKR